MAAEKHEKDVQSLLAQLESGGRQLERFKELSRTSTKTDAQLRAELEQMAQDIGARLAVPLDQRIGSGPIEDFELSAKLDAIVNRKDAPQYVVVVPESSSSVQAYSAVPNAATQGQLEQLFETARANDNPHNGNVALAALGKILQVNPTNAEARSLRNKVMRYYGPITLTVPLDYPTIQQAIDAAQSGDVVMVKPGRYREAIVLKEGIAVAGEDMEGCRLSPAVGYAAIISVMGLQKCGVRNLTLDGENATFTEVYRYGCQFEAGTGQVLVKSVEAQSPAAKAGIKAGAKLLSINGVAVTTIGAASRMLADHAVHFPAKPLIMQAELAGKSDLHQLVAEKLKTAVCPVGVLCCSTGAEITKCKIVNLRVGIALEGCRDGVTVTENRVSGTIEGITVGFESKALITQNDCRENSDVAISVFGKKSSAIIAKNHYADNLRSILIADGASATIEDNESSATLTVKHPIVIAVRGAGSNATLRGNRIRYCMNAVFADTGATVVAEANTFENQADCGVLAKDQGTNVRLLRNTFIGEKESSSKAVACVVTLGASLVAEDNRIENQSKVSLLANGQGTDVRLLKNTFVGKKPAVPDDGELDIRVIHVSFSGGSRGTVIGNTFTGEAAIAADGRSTQISVTDNDFTEVWVPTHGTNGAVIDVTGNNKGLR